MAWRKHALVVRSRPENSMVNAAILRALHEGVVLYRVANPSPLRAFNEVFIVA
jgi:hypothetical protein